MVFFANITDCIGTDVCLVIDRASRMVYIKEKENVVDFFRCKRLYGDDG